MKQVQFTITEDEIKDHADYELTAEQIDEILTAIENDECLWDDIEESIKSAIQMILSPPKL